MQQSAVSQFNHMSVRSAGHSMQAAIYGGNLRYICGHWNLNYLNSLACWKFLWSTTLFNESNIDDTFCPVCCLYSSTVPSQYLQLPTPVQMTELHTAPIVKIKVCCNFFFAKSSYNLSCKLRLWNYLILLHCFKWLLYFACELCACVVANRWFIAACERCACDCICCCVVANRWFIGACEWCACDSVVEIKFIKYWWLVWYPSGKAMTLLFVTMTGIILMLSQVHTWLCG